MTQKQMWVQKHPEMTAAHQGIPAGAGTTLKGTTVWGGIQTAAIEMCKKYEVARKETTTWCCKQKAIPVLVIFVKHTWDVWFEQVQVK